MTGVLRLLTRRGLRAGLRLRLLSRRDLRVASVMCRRVMNNRMMEPGEQESSFQVLDRGKEFGAATGCGTTIPIDDILGQHGPSWAKLPTRNVTSNAVRDSTTNSYASGWAIGASRLQYFYGEVGPECAIRILFFAQVAWWGGYRFAFSIRIVR